MKNKGNIFLIAVIVLSMLLGGCSLNSGDGRGTAADEKTGGIDVSSAASKKISDNIHIDQIGYLTDGMKVAVINGSGTKFAVVDKKSGKQAFGGRLTGSAADKSSGDTVSYCDFSDLKEPGDYYIYIPGLGRSYDFKIGDNVYSEIKDAMLKALYYQRCGITLEEKYAGNWVHDACHLFDGIIYGSESKTLDGAGGWHDAGDYGKYTVPAAKALADLMLAYEFFPDSFGDDVNIPESGNNVPDILDEAEYELQWLLKMQDKSTGGVYHKLTSGSFPELDTMPEADVFDLIFLPVSPTATADFAAVTAMASRVYKPFDKALSDRCLAASEKAWKWLMGNKTAPQYRNPADISTGDYGDISDLDERYWAAAELFRVTGKSEYHDYFKNSYNNESFNKFDFKWTDTHETYSMSAFGTIAYLFGEKGKLDETLYNDIKAKFISNADSLVNTGNADGYKVALNSDEYWWSSNMNVTDKGIYLIFANMLKPDRKYVQTAEDHLHYLLGRNSLGQCYVTGFGSKPVLHPSHRPSIGDGIEEPIPGLVAGGPDSSLEDPAAQSNLQGVPPAKCYLDDATAYSSNEITIYWNASAVFLAACFDK